jgi:hypothetical protein
MKQLLWIAPYLGLLLTGCNTTILVASSKEFRDYQKAIKPRLQNYEKPDWTPEERRRDSEACGAIGLDDRADIAQSRIQAEQLPGETEGQTRFRLRQAWLDCMREKGYQYIHFAPK